MVIDNLIKNFTNKFTDTIFYKQDSELKRQVEALRKLKEKYPDNNAISEKLLISEFGLKGEKEIEFELKNANIGMFVLHDVNLEYDELKAQIDYIIITPAKTYFVECKNMIGDIIIDDKGNFIRVYQYEEKKIKEGIYSPVNQAQRHVEVFKKIWKERNTGIIDQTIRLKHFDEWFIPIVVLANPKSILDDKYAPEDIKNHIIKSDRLIDYLKKDIQTVEKDCLWNKKQMNECATSIMDNYNKTIEKNYEKEFEEQFNLNNNSKVLEIRNKLIEYRKTKSKEKNIPAYYIFNNEELDKILDIMPKTKDELANTNILTEIKVKLYGNEIIKIINE